MRSLPDLRQRPGPVFGTCVSFFSPELIETCGLLGFGWVLLDAEHTPLSHAECRNLVRAADVVSLPCIVRVPEVRAAVIEGFLDGGVLGIMAPGISSAQQAAELVKAVKFSPQGQRGSAGRTRAADYGLNRARADFYRAANTATLTVALIETRPGLDALEDIMNVPGLDYVAIGPNDLALSMGVSDGGDAPVLREVLADAQRRIQARGKPQLVVVSSAREAALASMAGAQLIAVSDSALFASAASSFLSIGSMPPAPS